MGHAVLYAKQCNLYKCKNWNIRLIIVIKTSIYLKVTRQSSSRSLYFLDKKYIISITSKAKVAEVNTIENAATVHRL